MISNALDLKIEALQKELTSNAKEMIRLQRVMEDETRELMEAQAERDRISSLRVHSLNRAGLARSADEVRGESK